MPNDELRGAASGRFSTALYACLAVAGLVAMPAVTFADEPQLVAGEPLVLAPPHINKSVRNPVLCLAFVGDGDFLATGATSGLLIWDVKTGKLKQTLEVDERAVDSLAVDPNGSFVVAGGATGVIKIFDARTFNLLRTLGPADGAVNGLAISHDGKLLAAASPNGREESGSNPFDLLVWDLATGELLRTIPHARPEFGATALAFLPDGKQLVTAGDRTFRVIDVRAGKEVKAVDLPDLPRTLGSIAVAADGRLATGVFEPKVRLWDTRNWQQLLAWNAHDAEPPPRTGVASVSFSPDGRYVLTGGMDCMACVWDSTSGRRLLELDARGDASARWITGVAMTADHRLLAASHYGSSATLWRLTPQK